MRTAWIPLLLTLLTGCGLGTEVGNGAKPSGDGNTASGGSTDTSVSNNSVQTASNANNATPGDSTTGADNGGAGADAGATGSAQNSTTEGSGSAGSSDATWPSIPNLTISAGVLFASCGSPFGDTFTSPVSLAEVGANNAQTTVITATQDQTSGTWSVTIGITTTAFVTKDSTKGPYAVSIAGQATDSYTCSAPETTTAGTTITLTAPDGATTAVTWLTSKATNGETTLESITITPSGGTSATLVGVAK